LKGDYNGDLLSVRTFLFFPGIFKHHHFYFEGAFEKQHPENYIFQSRILFPRGYEYVFERNIMKGSANYTLPIAYPDVSLLHTLYFKRLAVNLFYDYGMIYNTDSKYFRSSGLELKSETFFFHIPVPLILGVRGSYLFDDDETFKIEATFSLNFR